MNAIKEKYCRAWMDSVILELKGKETPRACHLVTHWKVDSSIENFDQSVHTLRFRDERKVYMYWTEFDLLQQQCRNRLKEQYNVEHVCLNKKMIGRLLETNEPKVIVVISNKLLAMQFMSSKSNHHVISRPPKVDATALEGYSNRICIEMASILDTMTKTTVGKKLSVESNASQIKYSLGCCTFETRNNVIENAIHLIHQLSSKNLCGITLQCCTSHYLSLQ